ncbi:hypothetical protein GF358_03330 [Candidatus Woesearchaeota archaeon]|nr:hypothetical protein [Candidatus Woesearchaeota archaeon]
MIKNQEHNSAVIGSIRLGKRIQEEFPEVALFYRQGKTLTEIINTLDLQDRLNIASVSYLRNAVSLAIRGYGGPINTNISHYQGLITDNKELEKLAEKHNSESGKDQHREKKGMFSLSEKERKEVNSEAGKTGGKKAKKLKLGIHGRKYEQKYSDGCLGAIAKGYKPWIKKRDTLENGSVCIVSEKDCACELAKQEKYQRGKQTLNGKIAKTLNELYHNGNAIRTSSSVHNLLQKRRGNR